MYYFQCDYAEGAHPAVLDALVASNLEQTPGYGTDAHCERARALIREACDLPEAGVHFLVGGTQANTTILSALLRPYQGAVCADTGHIACHETGAIEATGHKVLTLPNVDGKLTAVALQRYLEADEANPTREHTVQPGAVYLSFPTESGTLYSLPELAAIQAVCRAYDLPLFIDGARMAYGLTSPANDVSLTELARLCDVFYLGGTKCGALFGEAVVFSNPALDRDFRYYIKRHGGMLAKGRLLGVQFETLFTDRLYLRLGAYANDCAMRIREAFLAREIPLWGSSMTNQQFPILTAEQKAKLDAQFVSEVWETLPDGRIVTRFCTSWATTEAAMESLLGAIAAL